VTLKCTGIIDTNGFGVSIAGVMNGAARLTKTGLGNLTLTGANTYSGATTIIEGSLLVSSAGSLASSGVTVNSGANFVYNNNTTGFAGTVRVSGTLGGSGRFLGTIEGGGQVGPGNSPGILTAAATDPTEGMDYNFEFTSTGMPTYSNNTASVNDVLRLTDATTPFTASLTSPANVVSIYLNVSSLTHGDTFYGGFYTDKSSSFFSSINGATYNYYLFNAEGGTTYNGVNYDLYGGPHQFTVETVAQTANFGGGDVNGHVMKIGVLPEPSTMLLMGVGFAVLLFRRHRSGQ